MPRPYESGGRLLRTYRRAKGLSQSLLARLSHVNQGNLSRTESGQKRPSADAITHSIAPALGLDDAATDQLLVAFGHSPQTLQPDWRHPVLQELMLLMAENLPREGQTSFTDADLASFVRVWQGYRSARLAHHRRAWAETIAICDRNLELLTASYMRLGAYLMDTRATALAKVGKLSEADQAYQTAWEWAAKSADEYIQGMILSHQGDMLRDRTRPEEALEKYREARRLFARHDEISKVGRLERKIGLAHLSRGAWDEAQGHLQKSLAIFQEQANQTPLTQYEFAKTYLPLGWIASLRGEWDEAVRLRERALAIAQEYRVTDDIPDAYLIMEAHLFCGFDYTQLHNFDKALAHLDEAQKISDSLGEKKLRGHILLGLGRLFHAKGQNYWTAAADRFERASVEHRLQEDDARYAVTLLHWSKLLLSQDKLSDAHDKCRTALTRFLSLDNHYYQVQAQVQLCRIYRARREYGPLQQVASEVLNDEHNKSAIQLLARLRVTQGLAALDQGDMLSAVLMCADGLLYAERYNDYLVKQLENELDHTGVQRLADEQGAEAVAAFYRKVAEELQKHGPENTSELVKRLLEKRDQLLNGRPIERVIGANEWRWV